jgi:hypothetical protein
MNMQEASEGRVEAGLFQGCEDLDEIARAFRDRPTALWPSPYGLSSASIRPASLIIAGPLKTRPACRTKAAGYVTPRELARRWGVHVDKVLTFIRSGRLLAFNVASSRSTRPRYRISDEAVRAFEVEQAASTPASEKTALPPQRRRRQPKQPAGRCYF